MSGSSEYDHLMTNYQIVNNNIHGIYKITDPYKITAIYNNGILNGELKINCTQTLWHKLINVKCKLNYVDGILDGPVRIEYDSHIQKYMEFENNRFYCQINANYNKGVLNGRYIVNTNFDMLEDCMYVHGQK